VVLASLIAEPLVILLVRVSRQILTEPLVRGIVFALLVSLLIRHRALQLKVESQARRLRAAREPAKITMYREVA
jgi:hypothetical protein